MLRYEVIGTVYSAAGVEEYASGKFAAEAEAIETLRQEVRYVACAAAAQGFEVKVSGRMYTAIRPHINVRVVTPEGNTLQDVVVTIGVEEV